MTTREILEGFREGSITLEEAEGYFRKKPFEDLGYARLDLHRQVRSGFPEVVYCSGKDDAFIGRIFQRLYEENGRVMGTRATEHQYEIVREVLPEITYDPVSRILKAQKEEASGKTAENTCGRITVCCAGTSDIPVAEEAAATAEFLGAEVTRVYDAGVSGLHRLLSNLDEIQTADCVIAVAGMEGALVSVIGGLVQNPVIAVPTSVGYGASFGGVSALLTMINSCANGISVVNIDNGYGAGYIAAQIGRLAAGAGRSGQE